MQKATEKKAQAKRPAEKTKRKLTRAEKKQIAEVIQKAKGDGKPHTAQQTIPYVQMYPDGICHVSGKRYSKTVAFEDINYQLAQADDKTAIFENWCDFLNYFDASVQVQLSFINQGGRGSDAENAIHIPVQNDAFNSIRTEYSDMEAELQQRIDNIERDYPGYDEYRYDLDNIGHNPHALASYLTALLQSYTPQSAQAELDRIFNLQYKLTITEEVEIRYRTETSTDPETGETTTEKVSYEYYILNVSLTSRDIATIAPEVLNEEQLAMFRVYLEPSGNQPLLFGGGSSDTSASEDLSGVQFVNGTRPGNTEIVDIAKRQVGNVGGRPYWIWYGFNSRVEWCACFVSWCYGQMGLSEPRFAACQSQGIPWFTSRGQWGARGYENIAPGDAIFFDWDLDGSADHVGIVIGTDGSRVYTVEGNSGDACKIKSYPLDYACIKGYGLMNWN